MKLPIPLSLAQQKGLPLPKLRHWKATSHVFEEADIWALNAALVTGRPLLLRGEPGTGKSQLARAAAQQLGWPFISRVVNARFEPEDLLYRFDAVARLAKAQILGNLPNADPAKELDPSLFLQPEVLWWALNHNDPEIGARARYEKVAPNCGDSGCHYDQNTGHPFADDKGVVVLIDEIDKADSDVPNSLLEVLSLGGFQLPYGGGFVQSQGVAPLIIITTNEDRELPPAFLRRCLVHQMDLPKLPEKEAEFNLRVKRCVDAHFETDTISQAAYAKALAQLKDDRLTAQKNDLPKPGQAELLDLLMAVTEISRDPDEQLRVVEKLKLVTFSKHRPV